MHLCAFAMMAGFGFDVAAMASAKSIAAEESTVVQDGLIYTVSDTSVILQGCENTSAASVVIPAEIDGKPLVYADPAFRDCTALTSIQVAEDNASLCSIDGVLFNRSDMTLLEYPCAKAGAYTIPDAATLVGFHAFQNCVGLTAVTLHDNVVLNGWAFENCTNLATIEGTAQMQDRTAFARNGCFDHCQSSFRLSV